jgi:pentatricopeptide repeat protein
VDIVLVYLCRFVVRAPNVLLRGFSRQREIQDFMTVWSRRMSHR